jgi:hypothetical protein
MTAVTNNEHACLGEGTLRVAQHAAGASRRLSAHNAASGRFSVRATAGGASKTAGPLAPCPGDTVNQDFAFPWPTETQP